MKNRINEFSMASLFCTMLLVSGTSVASEAFDGSKNLVCAVFDVVGCIDTTHCTNGPARKFELPEFMTLDFKKNLIHVTYDGGQNEAESPFKHRELSGNQLILQGIENGHGWTMAIARDSGRMTIAAVGDELTFTIIGACTLK